MDSAQSGKSSGKDFHPAFSLFLLPLPLGEGRGEGKKEIPPGPWPDYRNTLDRLLISRDEITRIETRNPLYLRIPFLESNRIPGRSASPDGPDCLIDLAGCPESPTMVAEYGIRIESGKAWT